MLREIAEADYGLEADECYALLQPILKTGLLASGDFHLREVLERPGGHGQRGHWMRLFACTALVRLAPKYRALWDSESDTPAQFTASAIELGQPVARAAADVLAWHFLAYPGTEEDPAFLASGRRCGAPWPTEFWRGRSPQIHARRTKHCGYWANWLPGSDFSL